MRVLNGAFVLVALLVLVQVFAYLPRVDGPLPSHFGINGRPDAWTDRGGMMALTAGVFALAMAIGIGVPALLLRMPPAQLNVPRREEWLAPEAASRARRYLTVTFRVIGAACLALFLTIQQWVYSTAISGDTHVPPSAVLALVVAFLAIVLGVVAWMCRRFARGPA